MVAAFAAGSQCSYIRSPVVRASGLGHSVPEDVRVVELRADTVLTRSTAVARWPCPKVESTRL